MMKLFGIFCFLIFQETTAKTKPDSLLAGRQYCGYQHTDDYPRMNNSISIDEFPWTAQLLFDNNKLIRCTGSLINNRYILTAAHCLDNRFTKLIGVRLGDYNVTSDKDCVKDERFGVECSDPTQEFEIEKKHTHPVFNGITPAHDIALLRLAKEVTYSDYIRPICLPRSTNLNLKKGARLSTTGWGILGEGLNKTEVKKKVITTLEPLNKCMAKQILITEDHLCAKEQGEFTCQGDSGAPLMNSIKNQWEQVGVLAYRESCGSRNPAIYVNIANYIQWIKSVLEP